MSTSEATLDPTENKIILDAKDIDRIITRLCYQITEANQDLDNIVLIGIHRRGVPLAARIKNKIKEILHKELYHGSLDISFHRDDYRERLELPEVRGTDIAISLNMKTVILIDDVLYTGRTTRAAMDELNSFGRPSRVQLAVLVDRGHRELPIKADFVGKNIPTNEGEHVDVELIEIDGADAIYLISQRKN